MLNQADQHPHGRGIVVSVADSLVGDDFDAYVALGLNLAVGVELIAGFLFADGDEDGAGPELVEMVEHRSDAAGAEIGDEHTGMEGAGAVDDAGHPTDLIQRPDEVDKASLDEGRNGAQRSRDGVGSAVIRLRGIDLLADAVLDLIHHVDQRVLRLKGGDDRRLLALERKFPLAGEGDSHIVMGIDVAPRDKPVELRPLGHHAHHRGHEDMEHAQIGQVIPAPLPNKSFQLGNFQLVVEKNHGVQSGPHNRWDDLEQGVDVSDPIPIVTVSESFLRFFHPKFSSNRPKLHH